MLPRLLVHQLDHEVEVSRQRLEVTLQIRGRLDQVGTRRQILLDAGVANAATVVIGADKTPVGCRQREDRVAVCRHQVDEHTAALRQGEGVGVGGMLRDDACAARVDRPGAGCSQIDARLECPQMDRLATGDVGDGKREVRRAACASADRRGFDDVGARCQVALDACVEVGAAVVVVGDAAPVLSQQVEVGISIVRRQVDSDPVTLGDLEAVAMRIAVDAEARVAVLGRPAPARVQSAVPLGAEDAEG